MPFCSIFFSCQGLFFDFFSSFPSFQIKAVIEKLLENINKLFFSIIVFCQKHYNFFYQRLIISYNQDDEIYYTTEDIEENYSGTIQSRHNFKEVMVLPFFYNCFRIFLTLTLTTENFGFKRRVVPVHFVKQMSADLDILKRERQNGENDSILQ